MKIEAKEVVREVHEGICGGHVGYQTLIKQIIRAGYYWKTMQQDCYHFVKKCALCQIHAPSIHAPATYLQSVISPWPFSMWAFDVVGPITPASNNYKYFLATIEYFTKWVEAITLRTVEGRHMVSFIHKNILCHFGVPHDIVSNNDSHFKNERMRTFGSKFRIQHHFSAPYYPQGNGQAEAANKILIRILERTLETGHDWHEKIHDALWAYRTTIRTPTNATLSEFVYGTEVVLPLHVQKPALKFASLLELPAWSVSAAATGTTGFARWKKAQSSRARSIISAEGSQTICKICHWKEILSQWSSVSDHGLSQAPPRWQMVAELGRALCCRGSITPQFISAHQCRWCGIIRPHQCSTFENFSILKSSIPSFVIPQYIFFNNGQILLSQLHWGIILKIVFQNILYAGRITQISHFACMCTHLQHFAFICICMHSFAFMHLFCINLHYASIHFPFRLRDKPEVKG